MQSIVKRLGDAGSSRILSQTEWTRLISIAASQCLQILPRVIEVLGVTLVPGNITSEPRRVDTEHRSDIKWI